MVGDALDASPAAFMGAILVWATLVGVVVGFGGTVVIVQDRVGREVKATGEPVGNSVTGALVAKGASGITAPPPRPIGASVTIKTEGVLDLSTMGALVGVVGKTGEMGARKCFHRRRRFISFRLSARPSCASRVGATGAGIGGLVMAASAVVGDTGAGVVSVLGLRHRSRKRLNRFLRFQRLRRRRRRLRRLRVDAVDTWRIATTMRRKKKRFIVGCTTAKKK